MSYFRLLMIGFMIYGLSACGGSDSLDPSVDPSADPDGDGLTNQQELETYFTNTTVPDTDGDGISDGDEVNELGFNPASNLYRFNPLIADLPAIGITVETVPDLVLHYTDTVGGEHTISNSSGGEVVVTNTNSFTEGISTTVGFETEVSITPSAKVSGSVTGSFEATQEHSLENHQTWENVMENSSSSSRETGDATLRVGISIENISNLTYSLEHLSLVALYYDGTANALKPIATLSYDSSNGGFQRTSFAPGESSNTLLFSFNSLDLGTALHVLKDMHSMTIEPALYELTGIDGTPIDFNKGEVSAKTAAVRIDYGIVKPQELYNVSILSSIGSGSLTIGQILNDILRVPYTGTTDLQSVRGVGGDTGSRWLVHVTHNDGFVDLVSVYDPAMASYDLNTIQIFPGDKLNIIYLTDPDGDGSGIREEILSGTDPNNNDTDGDGLSDDVEIHTSFLVNSVNLLEPDRYPSYVKSNPLLADADGDGLNDLRERERGLDPNNPDTDADGIGDFTDTYNGQLPVVADFSITPALSNGINVSGTATPIEGTRIIQIEVDWGDTTTDAINSTTTTPLNININHSFPTIVGDSASYIVSITTHSTDDDPNTVELPITHVGSVEIFKENSSDFFTSAQGWSETRNIRGVADLNGDDNLDLVGFGSAGVSVSLWDESSSNFLVPSLWINGLYGADPAGGSFDRFNHPRFVIDFDADGLDDIIGFTSASVIWSRNCPGDQEFKAASACGVSNDNTLFETLADGFGTNTGWNNVDHLRTIADVDGNGFLDIVGIGQSTISVARNNGNNTATVIEAGAVFTASSGWNNSDYYRFVKDINNDGRADIIGFGYNSATYSLGQPDATFGPLELICDSSDPCITYQGGWRPSRHPVFIEDVNNDNLPDIVGIGYGATIVALNQSVSTNIRFAPFQTWSSHFDYNDGWRLDYNTNPRFLADINSDGYKDLVGFADGALAVFNQLSHGVESFSTSIATLTTNIRTNSDWLSGTLPSIMFNSRVTIDYNDDGHADVVGFGNNGVVAQRTARIVQPVEQ